MTYTVITHYSHGQDGHGEIELADTSIVNNRLPFSLWRRVVCSLSHWERARVRV
jgi:hypothetical protein